MGSTSPKPHAASRSHPKYHQHPSRRRSSGGMPFARKVRYSLFGAILLILVIIYVVHGPAATKNSDFYQKTVALMEYRRGGPSPDDQDNRIPEKPIHRAGGLHFAEGEKHLTPEERMAMEQGKLKGEPPIGPDGEAIMGPVVQSNQQGQRPLIDTDAKLKGRLKDAENAAKKSADEKYRALKDIEDEVQKEREMRGANTKVPLAGGASEKKKVAEEDESGNKKEKSKEKAKTKPDDVDEEEEDQVSGDEEKSGTGNKGVAGRKSKSSDEKGDKKVDKSSSKEDSKQKPKSTDEDEEDKETTRIRSLLASILSKSPVTIFSKSYCPFSAKAKYILREAYTISPEPYVVELNEHPDGPALQQLLIKTTGRRTVPNVLVNGKSIGGGDETELLWKNGELPARIQQMAGKRVDSVTINTTYAQKFGDEKEKPLKG